jgi:hypothetical protein
MKKRANVYLAEIIPIILFFTFYVYSDETLDFSQGYFGKLIFIAIIVFYTSVHPIYGLFVCSLVVLYYQSDIMKRDDEFASYFSPQEFTNLDVAPVESFVDGLHFYNYTEDAGNSILSDRFTTEEKLFYGAGNQRSSEIQSISRPRAPSLFL